MGDQTETTHQPSSPSKADSKRSSRAHEIADEVESFAPTQATTEDEEVDSAMSALADHLIGWPPTLSPKRSRREEAEAFFAFSRRLAQETRVTDITGDLDDAVKSDEPADAGQSVETDQPVEAVAGSTKPADPDKDE